MDEKRSKVKDIFQRNIEIKRNKLQKIQELKHQKQL